jgi:hypothetical protein
MVGGWTFGRREGRALSSIFTKQLSANCLGIDWS